MGTCWPAQVPSQWKIFVSKNKVTGTWEISPKVDTHTHAYICTSTHMCTLKHTNMHMSYKHTYTHTLTQSLSQSSPLPIRQHTWLSAFLQWTFEKGWKACSSPDQPAQTFTSFKEASFGETDKIPSVEKEREEVGDWGHRAQISPGKPSIITLEKSIHEPRATSPHPLAFKGQGASHLPPFTCGSGSWLFSLVLILVFLLLLKVIKD